MNLEVLLKNLKARHAELTQIRWGVPYGYLKTIKSLKKVERLSGRLEERLRRNSPVANLMVQKQIDIGLAKWKANKRFLSLDVERTEAGVLHEIGVTIIQNREIQTFNYRVRGVDRGPKFIFGTTMEADVDIIKNLVRMHAFAADFYIGHDFRHDIEHLNAEGIELPNKFFYDTSFWGKAILGYRPKLVDLAQEFHVGSSQMHCGGNDSRYTGEIFLKIINTYGRP
jgi:hypothetical protein